MKGKRVDENVSAGVLIGNQTLVLQSISLSAGGLYTCVASNTVADGESNAVMLDIKCWNILQIFSSCYHTLFFRSSSLCSHQDQGGVGSTGL